MDTEYERKLHDSLARIIPKDWWKEIQNVASHKAEFIMPRPGQWNVDVVYLEVILADQYGRLGKTSKIAKEGFVIPAYWLTFVDEELDKAIRPRYLECLAKLKEVANGQKA